MANTPNDPIIASWAENSSKSIEFTWPIVIKNWIEPRYVCVAHRPPLALAVDPSGTREFHRIWCNGACSVCGWGVGGGVPQIAGRCGVHGVRGRTSLTLVVPLTLAPADARLRLWKEVTSPWRHRVDGFFSREQGARAPFLHPS
jgi:hypothetical protein